MRDVNGLSYRDIAEARGPADRHRHVAHRPRPRRARQDREKRTMSDPAPDPASLRLNAALDGELDAANALAFERDLAADPALAADYRRARGLARRRPPRGAARGGACGARRESARARPSAAPEERANVVALPVRARGPRATLAWLPVAASFAALGFAAGVRPDVAPRAGRLATGRRRPRLGFLPGRDRRRSRSTSLRPTGIRSNPGSPGGRRSAPTSSISRRRVFRSRAAASRSSTGFPSRRSSIATTSTWSPSRNCRSTRGGARAGSGRDGRRLSRGALEPTPNFAYVAVSDMDEKALAEFVSAFRAARAAPRSDGGRG